MEDKKLPLTQQDWLEFSKANAEKIKSQKNGSSAPKPTIDVQQPSSTFVAGEKEMLMENIRRCNSNVFKYRQEVENLEAHISELEAELTFLREFIGAPSMKEVYEAQAEQRDRDGE